MFRVGLWVIAFVSVVVVALSVSIRDADLFVDTIGVVSAFISLFAASCFCRWTFFVWLRWRDRKNADFQTMFALLPIWSLAVVFGLVLSQVFVVNTARVAHRFWYGPNHWEAGLFDGGYQYAKLHPNLHEGMVVARGSTDGKELGMPQYVVVKFDQGKQRFFEMADPQLAYPPSGAKITMTENCYSSEVVVGRVSANCFSVQRQ